MRQATVIVETLARALALCGGLVLLVVMVITSINVAAFALDRLARPFGGIVPGLQGYEDVIVLAMAVAAPLFLPWCQAERGHIAIDAFTARAPAALKGALDRIALIATAALALALAVALCIGALETRADAVLSPVLGWPTWPSFLPGVVGLATWSAVAAVQALTLSSRAPDPSADG
ncbi:MAG: TRAP transporter small permease subunit [Pseudomonadota bacterium]